MNINIKATGIDLTDPIREYVFKKISSVEKYITKNSGVVAQVEVGKISKHHKGGEIFRAEVKLVGGGLDLYAVSEKENLYSAIDVVENEITRELVSKKGRHVKMLRHGERAIKYMMKGITYPFRKRN